MIWMMTCLFAEALVFGRRPARDNGRGRATRCQQESCGGEGQGRSTANDRALPAGRAGSLDGPSIRTCSRTPTGDESLTTNRDKEPRMSPARSRISCRASSRLRTGRPGTLPGPHYHPTPARLPRRCVPPPPRSSRRRHGRSAASCSAACGRAGGRRPAAGRPAARRGWRTCDAGSLTRFQGRGQDQATRRHISPREA